MNDRRIPSALRNEVWARARGSCEYCRSQARFAVQRFSVEHVFPRGTLREPLAGLGRAGVVVLSRADMLSDGQRAEVCARVKRLAPRSAWACGR